MGPNDWDAFGYDDFVGSGAGEGPADNEDRYYDPNSITDIEENDYDEY